MAMLPITIYSREINPELVARTLREADVVLKMDGEDAHWRNAVVRCGREPCTLTFRHNPDYYLDPEWPEQMEGMRRYFDGFPDTERKSRALAITTTFRFALSVTFDPDCESESDPRWKNLYAVVEALDGVMFSPSVLMDARRRVLFSGGGEEDEDPRAVWPKVLRTFSALEPPGDEWHRKTKPNPDVDDATEAPDAIRVTKRALALCAVSARAILEQNPSFLDSIGPERSFLSRLWRRLYLPIFGWGQPSSELLEWVEAVGILDELEPKELEIVQCPLGRLTPRMQIDSTWRLEALVVLAWALGCAEIPAHDELVEFYPIWQDLGLLNVEDAKQLLNNPILSTRDEIRTLRGQLFAVHWRLRNFDKCREVLDFEDFAKTCWFGPLDIDNLPLIDGDLSVQGSRLDRTLPDNLEKAHSIAMERHMAANWLWDGPARYSEASRDT